MLPPSGLVYFPSWSLESLQQIRRRERKHPLGGGNHLPFSHSLIQFPPRRGSVWYSLMAQSVLISQREGETSRGRGGCKSPAFIKETKEVFLTQADVFSIYEWIDMAQQPAPCSPNIYFLLNTHTLTHSRINLYRNLDIRQWRKRMIGNLEEWFFAPTI